MKKVFTTLVLILSATLAFAQASPKLDYQLETLVISAQKAKADLRSTFVAGMIRTNANVTKENAASLFQGQKVQIRAIMSLGASGNIITFASSLQGVVNAAGSNDVISIQMSQRLQVIE